ncbi:hypothetical protein OEZ85_009618 [Tetradesmus obliquus]|uniref:Uncharacterized protein n=1 Tax=Tetradesmus obliquus TaxID=3088 RepID=A0ABY8U9J2_TETOB|nr:hypothetical protein OEZ85_009618 [Tetradesmus obliquus]
MLLAKLKDKDRQKNLLSDAEQLLHAAGVSSDGEVGRFVKRRGNLKHLTAFCKAGLHQLPLMTVMTMTEGDLCRIIATSETFFTNEGARQAGDKALHLTTVAGNVSSLRTVFRYVFGRSMTPGQSSDTCVQVDTAAG